MCNLCAYLYGSRMSSEFHLEGILRAFAEGSDRATVTDTASVSKKAQTTNQ